MAGFSADGEQNAAPNVSMLGTGRGAAKRHGWFYLTIGSAATPADQASELQVNRVTALGTSTSVTPGPLDEAEAAAVTTAGENHSAEPTKTAGSVLLRILHNSRAAKDWYSKDGRELWAPDTAANGLVLLFTVATGTQLYGCTVHFEE